MHTKTSALVIGILLGISGQASAAPFTYVSVSAGFSSNSITSPAPASLSVSGVGIAGQGSATATANADFGAVGVIATGAAPTGPAFPTINASAEAMFNDLLLIGGQPGAVVNVTFSLDLNGTCAATAGGTTGFPNAYCSAVGSLAGPPQLGLSVGPSNTSNLITFTWIGGNPLPITVDLQANGYAWNGSFDAEYGSTLHLYVWSTTPGVTIGSQSGHDYSPQAASPTVVPEPVTLMLVGPGLLALARRRARR